MNTTTTELLPLLGADITTELREDGAVLCTRNDHGVFAGLIDGWWEIVNADLIDGEWIGGGEQDSFQAADAAAAEITARLSR